MTFPDIGGKKDYSVKGIQKIGYPFWSRRLIMQKNKTIHGLNISHKKL